MTYRRAIIICVGNDTAVIRVKTRVLFEYFTRFFSRIILARGREGLVQLKCVQQSREVPTDFVFT